MLSREEEGGSSTLRILVATDCHLGYLEKDEERRFDSFDTFEEICSLAEKHKVNNNFVKKKILFVCVCMLSFAMDAHVLLYACNAISFLKKFITHDIRVYMNIFFKERYMSREC